LIEYRHELSDVYLWLYSWFTCTLSHCLCHTARKSLFMALTWSDDVTRRFNLTTDLVHSSNLLSTKLYSCYTIEYWYRACSWTIYFCFFLSIILALVHHRLKLFEFLSTNNEQTDTNRIDVVFYYFCLAFLAIIMIIFRMFIEHYLLGRCQWSTMMFLLWYSVSFAIVCVCNQT
jgi:hypothetical protein